MKNYLIFAFIIAGILNNLACYSQNLLSNGSFEQLTSCPTSVGGIDSCVGWFIEANSPDCLATCAIFPVSVPDNFFGNQLPFEGNNYAGIYTFVTINGSNYREIFGTKLVDSLIKGRTYHFSMRISRAYNGSLVTVANNHLGAKLSKNKYVSYTPFSIDNFQQLDEDSIITDTINWILLSWNFLSDSNYKYIYIGNFHDDIHTDTLNASTPNTAAYYYVDSLNLNCKDCETGITRINSNTGIIYDMNLGNLSFHINGTGKAELLLYNTIGQIVFNAIINDGAIIHVNSFPEGIFFAVLKTNNGEIVKKIFIE